MRGTESIHFNDYFTMAGLAKLGVPHRGVLNAIFFVLVVSISPLMLAFYLLCWIRAKLTALVYSMDHTLMSGYDATAGIELNSNNSILNSIMIINGHLSVEDVKDLTMNNVFSPRDSNNKPLFAKMTRSMSLRAGYLFWSKKDVLNIDDHIKPFRGQPPQDEAELKSVVNHLCNIPLDLSKPGWEFHVISLENRQTKLRRTCLLSRVHHSIADGMPIYRLLIEQLAGNHGAFQHIETRLDNKLKSNFKCKFDAMSHQINQIICTTMASPTALYKAVPSKNGDYRHNTKLSGRYIFDWTSTIKLSTIKDIKNATSTTVNDVLMSCLAGACRKHLLRHGVNPPYFLNSAMATAFHKAHYHVQLKNRSIGVMHQLPTGDMDCTQRLQATKAIMDELKHSPEKFINRWFFRNFVNTIPYTIMKWLLDSAGINFIFSNVPGPTNIALMNGYVIDSCIGLPQTRVACDFGVAAVSYAGNLMLSLIVDTAIISTKEEAGLVLSDFAQEVQNLYDAVIPPQSLVKDKYPF